MKLPKIFYDHIGLSIEEKKKENKKASSQDNFEELVEEYLSNSNHLDKDSPISQSSLSFSKNSTGRKPKPSRKNQSLIKVDLHHLKLREALEVCEKTLRKAITTDCDKVLFITGKGMNSVGGIAVLKEEVFRYLRQQDAITYLEQAPRHLGGEGAWLVYIKKE